MGPPLVNRRVSNLLVVHFIGRLSLKTKPRPKKSADFIDRPTSPSLRLRALVFAEDGDKVADVKNRFVQ